MLIEEIFDACLFFLVRVERKRLLAANIADGDEENDDSDDDIDDIDDQHDFAKDESNNNNNNNNKAAGIGKSRKRVHGAMSLVRLLVRRASIHRRIVVFCR